MKLFLALALVSSLSFAAEDKKPAEAPKKGQACCQQDKGACCKDKAACEGKDAAKCAHKDGAKDCPGHAKADAKKSAKKAPEAPKS